MKTRSKVLLTLVLITALVAPAVPFFANSTGERIANGSFEEGFGPNGVGNGWQSFHNDGLANYGWYDETWAPCVADGKHAQLIEINTIGLAASEADRYAGIFQTVAVVPGTQYQFSFRGMVRSTEGSTSASGHGYRIQWGVDYAGGNDWTAVTNWTDVNFPENPRLSPGAMQTYSTFITAGKADRLTVFLRAWKKWGTAQKEGDFDVDMVSLLGATPADATPPKVALTVPPFPQVGKPVQVCVKAANDVGITELKIYDDSTLLCSWSWPIGPLMVEKCCTWTPATAGAHTLKAEAKDASGKVTPATQPVTVGAVAEYLKNGNFEGGFGPDGLGFGWKGFNNGGLARFSYYDETWMPVIWDGSHGQLMEIDTFGLAASEVDRYMGIYQTVTGLTPGASYVLTIHGLMRTTEGGAVSSGYGYRIQWGADYTGGTDWKAVGTWTDLGWNKEYPRLAPGAMDTYTTVITAPSDKMTLFIRAWKKWPTGQREFDIDLDGLSLTGFK